MNHNQTNQPTTTPLTPLTHLTLPLLLIITTLTTTPTTNPHAQTPTPTPNQTKHGNGTVTITGELKTWHKTTLTLNGPHAHENDPNPNPFTDYNMTVQYTHKKTNQTYTTPGYFAADGNAANTSAQQGNKWKTHLTPDYPGAWTYHITFTHAKHDALNPTPTGKPLHPYHGQTGQFTITPTDKTGKDLRAQGRLQNVGKRYLQHAATKKHYLKAGPDSPETLLAYQDFDNTTARKKNAPIKTWQPHLQDWKPGNPTWKNNKGKALIGALNYLAAQECNTISFIPYNHGGDGDNTWPFTQPHKKLHYDCSKLDQWSILFDHAQTLGIHLHFKLQEQENDDNQLNNKTTNIPQSLDNGNLGPQRKLYCRELIARYAHNLAITWNIGEENTQTTQQQHQMATYIQTLDPYQHNIVLHTFPNQQNQKYLPHLHNPNTPLTGLSLQNHWQKTHQRTLHWIKTTAAAGKNWIITNDEQNPANHGVPPDPGYQNQPQKNQPNQPNYDLHHIRKYTLWGNLMAGGAGIEYYFGYHQPQNDLNCQDFRSRHQTWQYTRNALNLFQNHDIPYWNMTNTNHLIGNHQNTNDRYCFAQPGEHYLIYLPQGGTTTIDLTHTQGTYQIRWYDPRNGGPLKLGTRPHLRAGRPNTPIGRPPSDPHQDWLAHLKKQ